MDESKLQASPAEPMGWRAWLIDAGLGIAAAVLLLLILFFAGGGSNFIYIDF